MSFIERKLSVTDAPDVTRVQHLEKPRARILAATYNEKRGGLRDMAVKKKKRGKKNQEANGRTEAEKAEKESSRHIFGQRNYRRYTCTLKMHVCKVNKFQERQQDRTRSIFATLRANRTRFTC